MGKYEPSRDNSEIYEAYIILQYVYKKIWKLVLTI